MALNAAALLTRSFNSALANGKPCEWCSESSTSQPHNYNYVIELASSLYENIN